MISPDVDAATFDPDEPPTGTVGGLTEAYAGAVISVDGRVMTLLAATQAAPDTVLLVREGGEAFDRTRTLPAGHPYRLVSAPPADPERMLDKVQLTAWARELDRVGREIDRMEAELLVLRKRRTELSSLMLEFMAMLDNRPHYFDNRRAYVFPLLVPQFEQREDGRRYTMRDLAPVLRSIGRGDAVKPEEAGFNALLKIFRDHEAAGRPLPEELSGMVGPRVVHEVRIGVGRASKID